MSSSSPPRKPRRTKPAETADADHGPTLDLDRYIPAFVTFIANKLSNSATTLYQRKFAVNVTEWRIKWVLARLAGNPASLVSPVVGGDKGSLIPQRAVVTRRGVGAIPAS